jgi:uncharacterized protein
LNPHEKKALERKLVAFDDSTSSQIVVVTINSLDGWDIGMLATEIGQKWEVGQKGKDNGIVVLASKQDRKVFIATGYGMEGVVPDAIAKRIVESYIVPNFKQGNFYKGFDEATDVLISLTKGEYTADDIAKNTGRLPVWLVLVIILIILIILWIISKSDGKGRGGMPLFIPMGGIGYSSGGFGGGSSGGFGGFGGGSFGGGGAGGSW